MKTRQAAYGFARALNHDDYETAAQFLSSRCEYDTGSEWLAGRDEVLRSYWLNSETAKRNLEGIQYSSEVTYVNGRTAVIQFMDDLTHNGETHQYRCNQKLTFNNEGRIVRIEQKEISGQRERLYDFYDRACVVWE